MSGKYTIIVSSCDDYEDLWYPFFKILKAEWSQLAEKSIPIILNTESKSYKFDGLNLKTLQLYNYGDNPQWTARLRATLENVATDYIIMLLDDFYMQDRVDDDKINKCIEWMEQNHKISMFCFKETYASVNIRDDKYPGFERRPLFGKYKFNCQAGLWRRDRLISYLKKDENPWEWEVFGNWRSYRHPFHLFYSHIPGEKRVFPYIYEDGNTTFWESGVYRGKWVLPSVERVFRKHGITIDYSERGIAARDEFQQDDIHVQSKSREDAVLWKRLLWFARPAYCTVKSGIYNAVYILKHINHFF